MSGHTPGPWTTTEKYAERAGDWLIQVESEGCMIGEIYADTDEGEANARLIAAAPELLEVLEDIVASVMLDNMLDGTKTYPLMTEARRAIAKAKGETQ